MTMRDQVKLAYEAGRKQGKADILEWLNGNCEEKEHYTGLASRKRINCYVCQDLVELMEASTEPEQPINLQEPHIFQINFRAGTRDGDYCRLCSKHRSDQIHKKEDFLA